MCDIFALQFHTTFFVWLHLHVELKMPNKIYNYGIEI